MSDTAGKVESAKVPQLGRYLLLNKLGEGGMGEVFLAHDTQLDRQVALKVLPPHAVNDPGAISRFQREARALAKLSHPAIVQAFDSGEEDGKHFLVMEYVEGISLATLLAQKKQLSPTRAADFACQAAQALQHAHEMGLVHRDVKPSNLLVTAKGRVKILDLGLARFLQDQITDPAQTSEGAGMGTPDYAPPEQFRDAHAADARADIYSLGCTLYHLLSGQVPFPGSSFSAKYQAHLQQEPSPLEIVCPDAPAGLALVVQKMMAKRPEDRYQTAAEVADALAPHVASSSVSFDSLKSTGSWHLAMPTVREARPASRRLPWVIAGLSLAAALLMVLGFIAPDWFRSETPDRVAGMGNDSPPEQPPASKDGKDGNDDSNKPPPKPEEAGTPLAVEPDVLTVSQKAQGGGQYRSIGEALLKVRKGQTIRVLDEAVYSELLNIDVHSRHDGITLESPRRATLEITTKGNLIDLRKVARVTVRGFRLRSDLRRFAENEGSNTLVAVGWPCPGLVLESLVLEVIGPPRSFGVEIYSTLPTIGNPGPMESREEILVRGCSFSRIRGAVVMQGLTANYKEGTPIGAVVIRDNLFQDGWRDVWIGGNVSKVQVVGNRFSGASLVAIQLEKLMAEQADILLANNTIFRCNTAFRLWDTQVRGRGVQIRNNLMLEQTGPGMLFLDSGGDADIYRGPGDGAAVEKTWVVSHNWREDKQPSLSDKLRRGWIPYAKLDVFGEHIDGVERKDDNPDRFLRPVADSRLATAGAGQVDPSVPSYVGALPPEGMPAWDWDRTWRMPANPALLTVSEKPEGGGKYRTINDALKDAKPWATLRILDAATYPETLKLDDPNKYEGITLEAPQGAVLSLTGDEPALTIKAVPAVRVSGFRFREEGPMQIRGRPLVLVSGHCPDVVLEALNLRAKGLTLGIILLDVKLSPLEGPVVVRGCTVEGARDGIAVVSRTLSSGIAIHDNRVTGARRGIQLQGGLAHCQVAGNLVWNCQAFGVQMEDLNEGSKHVLIANNTVIRCGGCLSIWDNEPHKKYTRGQVEVCNNLLAEASDADAVFTLGVRGAPTGGGDGASLIKLWRFAGNYRDQSGTAVKEILPQAPGDRALERLEVASREPSDPDFLRSLDRSPLASGGVRDSALPAYVGAVPPKGAGKPWDWDVTWRSRAGKLAP